MNETQQSIDYELVNRGAEIFRGKGGCTACHYRLSPIAPSLHGIGAKGEDYVRQSIVDPDRIVARQYAESIVELANGKVVKGWLLSCDELGAHLLSIAPEGLTKNQSITVQDIAIENIAHDDDGKLMLGTTAKSPMPSNFHTLLTPEEIDALVYFLSRLPYSYY